MLLSPNVLNVKVKESGHDRDIFVLKTSFKASCHDPFARGHSKYYETFFYQDQIFPRGYDPLWLYFGCISNNNQASFGVQNDEYSMLIRIRE